MATQRAARSTETGPRKPARSATIYDVAELAGVSAQTVSRHVTGYSGISPTKRAKVTRAITALNYRPNKAARALKLDTSMRIVGIVQESREQGPIGVIQGASLEFRSAGYFLDTFSVGAAQPSSIDQVIEHLRGDSMAGILAFTPSDQLMLALRGTEFGAPIFIEDGEYASATTPPVNSRGEQLLIDHLVSLGHKNYFYIAGPLDWVSAREREKSYLNALAQHNLQSRGTLVGDWTSESGYRQAQKIPLSAPVTAIVCANDQMALGVIAALHENGLDVPGDISVVGFDDLPEAAYYRPPLTTIHQDSVQLGRLAAARLLNKIGAREDPGDLLLDQPTLVIRKSSAPPKKL